jgi:hypothetical protein
MMISRRIGVRVGAALASVTILGVTALGSTPARASQVPSFSHVFVIVGENAELAKVNRNTMPYFTGTVRPESAWLTNYWAITHFSAANYVAMTSGQYTPCEQFDYPPARCHQDVGNLFGQLTDAGIGWTAWNESMPQPCFLSNSGSDKQRNFYAVKHNPAVYYDDVVAAGGTWDAAHPSQLCKSHVLGTGDATVPNNMSAFNNALAAGTVRRFNFITPNMCEDGHDTCPPNPPSALGQFDDFLKREVPRILASPAFDARSVLIVTFDEGASTSGGGGSSGGTPCTAWDSCPNAFHGGGNVAFAAIGDGVRTGMYTRFANHYSLLRTLEEGYGLTSFVGAADEAHPITDIWS